MKYILALISLTTAFSAFAMPENASDNQQMSCKYSSAALQDDNSTIFAQRYCIYNVDKTQLRAANLGMDKQQLYNIIERYYETYRSIQSIAKRAQLVDMFLSKATQQIFTTHPMNNTKNSSELVFHASSNGRNIGIVFYPFLGELDDVAMENAYKDVIRIGAYRSEFAKELNELMKYIFLEDVSQSIKKSKMPIVSYNGDEDESEDGDDENSQEELDRLRDETYEDWAENQATGWCYECYSSWAWSGNTNTRYLEIIDDNFRYYEAYHYIPRSYSNPLRGMGDEADKIP